MKANLYKFSTGIKKMQLSRFIRYINDILTALSTYSNIVGHVHGPTLKASAILCAQIFHAPTRGRRNFRKIEIPGALIDIAL